MSLTRPPDQAKEWARRNHPSERVVVVALKHRGHSQGASLDPASWDQALPEFIRDVVDTTAAELEAGAPVRIWLDSFLCGAGVLGAALERRGLLESVEWVQFQTDSPKAIDPGKWTDAAVQRGP